jgi:hypothetical protein
MEPTDQILDGAGKDVVNPRQAIGGGRPLIKDKGSSGPSGRESLLEKSLLFPELELPLLQLVRAEVRPSRKRHQGSRSTR